MEIANRQDFLACLDCHTNRRHGLEVFHHAKRQLLAAVDEVGFDDFRGHDYEVIDRLRIALSGRDSDAALWGMVFIDLWFCSNFGGPHWEELIARDNANVRFAIEVAFWVRTVSRKDGSLALAGILKRLRCWKVAEQAMARLPARDGRRGWFEHSVVPWRVPGRR
jgi:hypothetical protein